MRDPQGAQESVALGMWKTNVGASGIRTYKVGTSNQVICLPFSHNLWIIS